MDKKTGIILGCALSGIMLTSCKEKKKEQNDIIVEKVVMKPQTTDSTMPASQTENQVKWVDGNTYTYTIMRAPNPELKEVMSHDVVYTDNSIRLTITRSDGSEFLSRTISKSNMEGYLNSEMRQHGVLLSMELESTTPDRLLFAVTVGCPDEGYDDFTTVQMIVSRMGEISFAPYTPKEE